MQDDTYESFLTRLPESVRAAIEAESIRAGREIPRERRKESNTFHQAILGPKREALVKEYVMRVFLAFSRAVCNLGVGGPFAVRDLESRCQMFLRLVATRAYKEYFPTQKGEPVRMYVPDFEKTLAGFEDTEEWTLHQAGLREVEEQYLAELDREAARTGTLDKQNDSPSNTDADTRSRIPVIQAWEAHKAMRGLIGGPHERIPEAVLRSVLVRQYGIAPEDVTGVQIRRAAADLVQEYGAVRIVADGEQADPYEETDDALWNGINQDNAGLEAELAKAEQVLEECPGFPDFRVRLHERSDPIVESLQRTPLPRLQALEWFEIHAATLLEVVCNDQSRSAYLIVLEKSYFPKAYEFLFGSLNMEPTSRERREPLLQLDSRLRFWKTEVWKVRFAHQAVTTELPQRSSEAEDRGTLFSVEDSGGRVTAGASEDRDPIAVERQSCLQVFKEKGRRQKITISDEMIAKAANPGKWNERSMVTWWKRNDPRCQPRHDRLIRAVLAKNPSDLWQPKADSDRNRP